MIAQYEEWQQDLNTLEAEYESQKHLEPSSDSANEKDEYDRKKSELQGWILPAETLCGLKEDLKQEQELAKHVPNDVRQRREERHGNSVW